MGRRTADAGGARSPWGDGDRASRGDADRSTDRVTRRGRVRVDSPRVRGVRPVVFCLVVLRIPTDDRFHYVTVVSVIDDERETDSRSRHPVVRFGGGYQISVGGGRISEATRWRKERDQSPTRSVEWHQPPTRSVERRQSSARTGTRLSRRVGRPRPPVGCGALRRPPRGAPPPRRSDSRVPAPPPGDPPRPRRRS